MTKAIGGLYQSLQPPATKTLPQSRAGPLEIGLWVIGCITYRDAFNNRGGDAGACELYDARASRYPFCQSDREQAATTETQS